MGRVEGVADDGVPSLGAIGQAGGVAKEAVVLAGQAFLERLEDGQSPDAGIEQPNGQGSCLCHTLILLSG